MPTCPGGLCGMGPKTSSPDALSTTVALQALPDGEYKMQQSDYEANYGKRVHNLMFRLKKFQLLCINKFSIVLHQFFDYHKSTNFQLH